MEYQTRHLHLDEDYIASIGGIKMIGISNALTPPPEPIADFVVESYRGTDSGYLKFSKGMVIQYIHVTTNAKTINFLVPLTSLITAHRNVPNTASTSALSGGCTQFLALVSSNGLTNAITVQNASATGGYYTFIGYLE